jgi:F0F1-type ATP synthase membrane subunit b/b'
MMTVDMLMVGFKFFLARLEGIAVSREKKVQEEKAKVIAIKLRADAAIQESEINISEHDSEIARATKAAKKMKEFIV